MKPIYIINDRREFGQGTAWTAICHTKKPIVAIHYAPFNHLSRHVSKAAKRPFHVCTLPRHNPLEPLSRHATLGAALAAARKVAAE